MLGPMFGEADAKQTRFATDITNTKLNPVVVDTEALPSLPLTPTLFAKYCQTAFMSREHPACWSHCCLRLSAKFSETSDGLGA